MFVVGQKVAVRKTGSYGVVTAVRGSIITVTVEDRYTLRFDRSQLDIVPSGQRGRQA